MVNFLENLDPFFLAYATLENPRDAAPVQFVVDDGVGTCSALDLPGDELIRRKLVVGEIGEEVLGPWRRLLND